MDRRPRFSLDLLRAFVSAARHLSFTRAANELFVTQSAVSHEIKKLEQSLGKPLFHRVNRSLHLTQAGAEFFHAAEEALGIVDAATLRIAGGRKTLSLTTTEALASMWLVPKLPAFTRAHPGIDVRIAASNEWLSFEREHLDIALRFVVRGTEAPAAPLFSRYEIFPVCAPALARDRKRPLRTPADLAHHVLLDFETQVYGRPWYDWDNWYEGMGIQRVQTAGRLRFSHYDQVIQAAMEGAGVAVGKIPHLYRHLEQGLLQAPMGNAGKAHYGDFYAVVSDASSGDPVCLAFLAWLEREIAEDRKRRENAQGTRKR
jgi:DNA-binding transcriptional LysR family regulator